MAKCKEDFWQADPNYLLRRCDLPGGVVDLEVSDAMDPNFNDPLAQMRLRVRSDHLSVGFVEVKPEHRAKRWGTRLYEEALRESCEVRKPLASDTTRSEFSEAFWRKQERKGRARCIKGKGAKYWSTPRAELEDMLDSDAITASEYWQIISKLPERPALNVAGERMWPCERYEMTQEPCPRGYSLDAVRPGRKPARKKRR